VWADFAARFASASADDFGDYDYTRSGNPTRTALESAIADVEGCSRAITFSTGMAALSAVTRLAKSGDEILLSDDSYGGTYRLLSKICANMGITTRYVAMDGPEGACRVPFKRALLSAL
jgi:cystathionine beta-lyase